MPTLKLALQLWACQTPLPVHPHNPCVALWTSTVCSVTLPAVQNHRTLDLDAIHTPHD